jgi:hypothetical protein
MRPWLVLLGGLLVWAAHFFAVYGFASLLPGTSLARWLTALLTLGGLVILAAMALPSRRRAHAQGDGDLASWLNRLELLGLALAAVAVLYQGLPALF